MIRELLKQRGVEMPDRVFKEVMTATTDDIKFNRIGFKKRTSIQDLLEIAEGCYVVLRG